MCGLFWGAHKSLAPRARTLLGGLGQATLSFFAVATLLFVFFGECPKFCDLAKQRRKIVGGVSEVGKDDFSLYFFWRCVVFLVFYFPSAAIARHQGSKFSVVVGPPELEPAARDPGDPGPHNAPPQPPPRERAPWKHFSNTLRRHHPTHEARKGPAEYHASLEHDLPDVTGPGLHGYTTAPPSPGTPKQEWEQEYAVDAPT